MRRFFGPKVEEGGAFHILFTAGQRSKAEGEDRKAALRLHLAALADAK